jgi:acetyltransferase-like isoleucine patch superfamily enzyme
MTEERATTTPAANPFDQGYFESEALRHLGFKSVGKNVQIAKNSTIIGLKNIVLGDNIRIDDFVVIACHSGSLELGNHIHIAAGCYLGCTGGIRLGDFSGLSHGTRIYSSTDDYSGNSLTNPTVPHQYLKLTIAAVTLEKHVIVGSGSVILPGVTIGEGSSVGALSLVTKSLDSWGVYFGSPARLLKARKKNLLELEKRLVAETSSDS